MTQDSNPTPLTKRQIGTQGEELAVAFLQKEGFWIARRNFTCRGGEIDLIAKEGETLVFIEVKYRQGDRFGRAAESVDRRKRSRLIKAARVYLGERDQPCRFDVVAIDDGPNGREIEHFRNAFGVDW